MLCVGTPGLFSGTVQSGGCRHGRQGRRPDPGRRLALNIETEKEVRRGQLLLRGDFAQNPLACEMAMLRQLTEGTPSVTIAYQQFGVCVAWTSTGAKCLLG